MNLGNATPTEALKLLRAALAQQWGIVLDKQPDGNFIARLAEAPAPAKP